MILLLASFALAAESGVSCVAVWEGPRPGCLLDGTVQVSATRPTAEEAARAARRALGRTVARAGADLVRRVPDRVSAEFALCEDVVVEEATISCSLVRGGNTDGGLCFITLPDPTCWDGTVTTFERGGWRAEDSARDALCEAVDERVVQQNYDDLADRRARCQESCVVSALVGCPPGR